MGFIYCIHCKITDKNYIGQTIFTIDERWSEHKACARMLERAKDEEKDLPLIQNSVLYRAMVCHGIENFEITEIEEVPETKDLNDREKYWIKEYDCLAPNGMNLTTGGDSGYNHAPQTIELMKKVKQSRVDNYRNEKLIGLPAKSAYRNNPKTGECILIHDHPLCKSKLFYLRDYESFDVMKKAVIDFMAELEQKNETYERKKNGDVTLPKGVQTMPNGYRVNKRHKGKTYDRKFIAKSQTMDEKKEKALEYYNKLMNELGLTP